MDRNPPETKRLRRNVEWALRRALDPAEVLPMVHRLARVAPEGTDEHVYAQRLLAELLADQHPWRAALSAKRVLAVHPLDDGAWSILALCYALLGHYRCAVAAYRRALTLAPTNAAYAHNLGHLLDVALGRPAEAIDCLKAAYDASGERADVAVSYAHALGRSGALDHAREVSATALRANDPAHAREHLALADWLDQGAPWKLAEGALLPRRPPARTSPTSWTPKASKGRRSRAGAGETSSLAAAPSVATLDHILRRGLARLPLDGRQRNRARGLARDFGLEGATEKVAAASLAAAIAYAIVYVDHIPLTQADVAACFRVSVPALRGRFKALRARLDLTPGDVRFATHTPR
jgi:Flp pilus assembly protein TadD